MALKQEREDFTTGVLHELFAAILRDRTVTLSDLFLDESKFTDLLQYASGNTLGT